MASERVIPNEVSCTSNYKINHLAGTSEESDICEVSQVSY